MRLFPHGGRNHDAGWGGKVTIEGRLADWRTVRPAGLETVTCSTSQFQTANGLLEGGNHFCVSCRSSRHRKLHLHGEQQSIYTKEKKYKSKKHGRERKDTARHTTIGCFRGSLIGGWVGCFFWGEHRIVPFMGSSMDT